MSYGKKEKVEVLFSGEYALITGTNRGIGRSILEKFLEHGANVFAHARKKSEEFEQDCRELEEKYQKQVIPVYFDLADEDSIKQAVKRIQSCKVNLTILVNNAGMVGTVNLFHMTGISDIRTVFETNFFGTLLLTQYVSKMMLRKKSGSIVNMVSCAALDGDTGMIGYVSSKGALVSATKRLALELGQFGIRVNAVAPGLTETDMGNMMSDELQQQTLCRTILNRKAEPGEIAEAVTFLASERASYITGQILRVDGGMLK